jgi:putative (di)nucleoside polyphosphate hydrolase
MQMPNKKQMPYRKGVNVVVTDGKGNFLLEQKNIYDENQWEVPGGGIKNNETPKETALRELEEELGTVTNFEVLGQSKIILRYDFPDDQIMDYYEKKGVWIRGQEKLQLLAMFSGDKKNIQMNRDEIKDIKWIKHAQLKDHLVFKGQLENMYKVLADFKQQGLL